MKIYTLKQFIDLVHESDTMVLGAPNHTITKRKYSITKRKAVQKRITEVDAMFAAATESQLPVLVGVFGEPTNAIDLSSNRVDGLELFKRDGTTMSAMIAVRLSGEMKNKAFYLNSDFTWEIKTDALGETCLVPTRK